MQNGMGMPRINTNKNIFPKPLRFEYEDENYEHIEDIIECIVDTSANLAVGKGIERHFDDFVSSMEGLRDVINMIPGLKLNEMERIREYSYCCGAGGGVKSAFPEFALTASKTRIKEAESTGAEAILSTCPFCKTNLQDGVDASDGKMEVYDIAELLLKSLGGDL